MNWCCYLSADQDQQKHGYGDIAQCLEWGAGCIFKFKTKLIFLFSKPWRNSARRPENPKFREKIQLFFFGSRLQVCLSKTKPTVI